jgi:uncharacterized membrane protein YfcA
MPRMPFHISVRLSATSRRLAAFMLLLAVVCVILATFSWAAQTPFTGLFVIFAIVLLLVGIVLALQPLYVTGQRYIAYSREQTSNAT